MHALAVRDAGFAVHLAASGLEVIGIVVLRLAISRATTEGAAQERCQSAEKK